MIQFYKDLSLEEKKKEKRKDIVLFITMLCALILVILFLVILPAKADTEIYGQNFNSLSDGNLSGQDSWSKIGGDGSYYIYDPSLGKSKGAEMNHSGGTYCSITRRDIDEITGDGSMTFDYWNDTSTEGVSYVYLTYNDLPVYSVVMSVPNRAVSTTYFSTGGIDYSQAYCSSPNGYNHNGYVDQSVGTLVKETWGTLTLEWDASELKARLKLNSGSFTDWQSIEADNGYNEACRSGSCPINGIEFHTTPNASAYKIRHFLDNISVNSTYVAPTATSSITNYIPSNGSNFTLTPTNYISDIVAFDPNSTTTTDTLKISTFLTLTDASSTSFLIGTKYQPNWDWSTTTALRVSVPNSTALLPNLNYTWYSTLKKCPYNGTSMVLCTTTLATSTPTYFTTTLDDDGNFLSPNTGFLYPLSTTTIPTVTTSEEQAMLFARLRTKFPFAYAYDFSQQIDNLYSGNLTATTSISYDFNGYGTMTLLSAQMLSDVPFSGLIRTILGYLIWLMFAFQMYRRTLTVFNTNPV